MRSEKGQSLVEYGLALALVAICAIVVLALLGPQLNNVFGRAAAALRGETSSGDADDPGIIGLTARVVDANGSPIADVPLYLFDQDGAYINLYGKSDENGELRFTEVAIGVNPATYQIRADYQQQHFWSMPAAYPSTNLVVINTGQQPSAIMMVDNDGEPMLNARVDVFALNGRYTGVTGMSDSAGQVSLLLSMGEYYLRTTYRDYHFWSGQMSLPTSTTAQIEMDRRFVTVSVLDFAGGGIEGVPVHLFHPTGRYTNLTQQTNSSGQVEFTLPQGDFQFRTDYRGLSFWSETISTELSAQATITTGGRYVTAQVTDQAGHGIPDVVLYAFTSDGAYTGLEGHTDAAGQIKLALPDGTYLLRADHQQEQYWSASFESGNDGIIVVQTSQTPVTATVTDSAGRPIAGAQVYLFNGESVYLDESAITDENGQATLAVAAGKRRFYVVVDERGTWSPHFSTPATTTMSISLAE